MPHEKPSYDEQAIAWTIAARDPQFDDWEGLTDWLEAEAAHATAFRRVAELDDSLSDLLRQPVKATARLATPTPFFQQFRRYGAIAAVVAIALFSSIFLLRPSGYLVETAPGEQRVIALVDGSRIAMNGNTQIRLYKDNPRLAELEQGEANFSVSHNASNPFVVRVGDAIVKDAGTAFNIIRTDAMTEVGVSEGLVIFNPDKENIALQPGKGLRQNSSARAIQRFDVPATAVGSWRRGELSYSIAPLERIAEDLSRALGEKVSVAGSASNMTFTGTIRVKANSTSFFAEAAPLMGVKAARTDTGWTLTASDAP